MESLVYAWHKVGTDTLQLRWNLSFEPISLVLLIPETPLKKLNAVTCISTVKPNLFADRGVFYKLFIYLSEYSIFEIGKPLHLAQISVQLYGF